MHQYGIGFDGPQARLDRVRTLDATSHRGGKVEAAERRGGEFALALANHDLHLPYTGMAYQRLGCPAQDGLAADRAILLGHAPAEAFASAGGYDECGNGHARSRFEGAANRV
ncbi:hypothetical protein GCM10023325_14460 [Sphingomonas lutea]